MKTLLASASGTAVLALAASPAMAAPFADTLPSLHPVALSLLMAGLCSAAGAMAVSSRRRQAVGVPAAAAPVRPAARGATAPPVAASRVEAGSADLFDLVPMPMLELDLDGRVRRANPAAQEAFGAAPKRRVLLAALATSLGRTVEAMVAAAAEGDASQGRVRIGPAGREAILQIGPGSDAGTLIAILSDASELRKLEEQFTQSQKMEAVGKLAGGVAHDFNNLLTAIAGHCDLLLLGKDISHPDYSDLMQVRQNSNRAASLVRQLLAFSRKQRIAPEILSVRDVISDAHYMLDRMIGETVKIRLQHGRKLGAVRADQQQLEQALMNLVVNARDAMAEGGTITIETRNVMAGEEPVPIGMPSGAYVEIAVSDEGTGIPDDVIGRIFEPFFTTKPLGAGTGLGLSTVYGIVKQAGGVLRAENRAEGGARFTILLPRVTADEPTVDAAAPRDAKMPDATGHAAVLLVEDEGPVRSFAARALTLRGYQVKACESAAEAITWLEDDGNPVDLIVSDVMMPGMGGPAFAATALEMRPGLPVIFISGYADGGFDKDLEGKDFFFLPKPFSLTELTLKVKEALTR